MRTLCTLVVLLNAGAMACAAREAPDFDKTVAPILASRCLECHSGAEKKGGLDLSQAKTTQTGGDSGAVIVSGKPAESLLLQRIEAAEMPPKRTLPAAERAVLQAWIAAGARWGTDPIDPYRYSTASHAGYDWWSLAALEQPALPQVKNQGWIKNPIDAFILEKLEAKETAPSPPADRRTLIRRLSFDLVGLPPSPEEVERFVADDAPDAYAQLVQRLLDSPHYGERWARHWLDIVHFGESDGFEYDRMRPNAWRYRDWVIDALNRDLPFDEFARRQIAGDVLAKDDPTAAIATGFLVAGAHDSLMPKGDAMRQIMRQDELEDIVSIVSQTFLGLTVHCARCHDHKFDPIPQVDYYRFAAALAGVRRGDRALPPQNVPAELTQRLQSARQQLDALEAPAREQILAKRKANQEERKPPQPLASWEFNDLNDRLGPLQGTASGNAKLENDRLVLDGKKAFVATTPLQKDLAEKTLEAWVQLSDLHQRGGGVLGVQTLDGNVFDAIVFGEREAAHWIAGSNFFERTKPFQGSPETATDKSLVHIAIAYHADGRIAAYRNGAPYGKAYQAERLQEFKAGEAQVVFGMRHSPAGGNKMLAGSIERASLYDRALSAEEVAASFGAAPVAVSEEELTAFFSPQKQVARGQLTTEIAGLTSRLERTSEAKVFAVTPQQPEVSHFLVRGNPQQKGGVVAPGGLAAAKGLPADFGLPADAPEADRRAKLAEWISSENNPLFARTIVNRVWHYHFGRGLVETPSDLGFSGGEPSHRELVDWLATELIGKKWSLKELHRAVVSSATYQQASLPRSEALAIDADNRLLWRYSPRRLEAEAVRDAMLAVAGELNRDVGGPAFMDFRPYLRKGAQFYDLQDIAGAEFQRRSVYRMWVRGGKNPLLDAFDCPDPSTATPSRGSTTTPLQALALLNNAFTLRIADRFAERLEREAPGSVERQVHRAFELAIGRAPTSEEAAASAEFLRRHGLGAFGRVLLNTNGFLYVN